MIRRTVAQEREIERMNLLPLIAIGGAELRYLRVTPRPFSHGFREIILSNKNLIVGLTQAIQSFDMSTRQMGDEKMSKRDVSEDRGNKDALTNPCNKHYE